MPDTDRRTVRRPARPRPRNERETTMRELVAFIRAAVEAAPYYVQARLDQWAARNDPHLGEWPGDSFDEPGVPLPEIEKFLDDVRGVETLFRLPHDGVQAYIEGTLGIDLDPWQRNLLGVVYGPQAPYVVQHRPEVDQ